MEIKQVWDKRFAGGSIVKIVIRLLLLCLWWNYHVHEELLQLDPTVDTDLWYHCLIEIEVKQRMCYIYPWQSQISHNFDDPTEKA